MYTESNNLADLLLVEVHPAWTRQKSTLADQSGADVPLGTVLGKITASGKLTPIAFAANDGSEAAAAVQLETKLGVDADVDVEITKRGAVINSAALVWPAGATDNQKAAALAQLEALGVVSRAVL